MINVLFSTVTNIAVGVYLFDSGLSEAFTIFLIASSVGVLMYISLHVIYNVLPKVYKEKKGGMKH